VSQTGFITVLHN